MKSIFEAIQKREDFELPLENADFFSGAEKVLSALDRIDSFIEKEGAFLYRAREGSGPRLAPPELFSKEAYSLFDVDVCLVQDQRLVDAVLKQNLDKAIELISEVREEPYLVSVESRGTFNEKVVVRGKKLGGLFSLVATLRRSLINPIGLSDSISLERAKLFTQIAREIIARRPDSILSLTSYEVDILLAEVSDLRFERDCRNSVWFKPLSRALTSERISEIMKRDFCPNASRLFLYAQFVGARIPEKWEREFSDVLRPRHFRDRECFEKQREDLLEPLRELAEEAKRSVLCELARHRKNLPRKLL